MKLLPFYSIDKIESYLGVDKQTLIQHVNDNLISLAVPEHSLGMPLYSNLLNELHNSHHFEVCGSCRFIYIHQNVISLNEDLIFTDGKIQYKSIVNFEKSPIGHPDNGFLKDAFRADFGSEYYEKWWYETHAEKECSVYLTCDAIRHSPMRELYMSLMKQELPEAQLQPIKLEENKEKTKPINGELANKRIIEELREIGVLSCDDLIPRGKKTTITITISEASNGKYTPRAISERILKLGYKSEHNYIKK